MIPSSFLQFLFKMTDTSFVSRDWRSYNLRGSNYENYNNDIVDIGSGSLVARLRDNHNQKNRQDQIKDTEANSKLCLDGR